MKTIKKTALIILGLTLTTSSFAQKDKSKQFVVTRIIKAPADKVWKVVGEDFVDIAKSHPKLASSHYVEGTPTSGEGCTRVCNLDEAGKKYTQEKQVDYNPEEQSFKAEISHVGGLPLDQSKSFMLYNVDPIDENTSKLTLDMTFLTNPAFMGSMAKGKFKKNIEDYALAIEHHVLTGEDVNPDNFKEIKKLYK